MRFYEILSDSMYVYIYIYINRMYIDICFQQTSDLFHFDDF